MTTTFKAYVRLLRPQQWVKNAFVAAPLLFGRQLTDAGAWGQMLIAAACFCAASSAIYILNDYCDREEDRQHPLKRHRPIAAGLVGGGGALVLAAVLAVGAVACSGLVSGVLVGLTAAFIGLNAAYSFWLKHVVIVDALGITGGFVLRILAGAAAAGVTASPWLILCTIFISLFLAFTKRRAELAANHTNDEHHTRPVLRQYSVGFLDQLITVVTAATILCYALYTVDAHTVALIHSRALLWTIPPVIYGVFRYLYLIHQREGEDPTGLLLRDVPLVINVLIWVILAGLVVYRSEWFAGFSPVP